MLRTSLFSLVALGCISATLLGQQAQPANDPSVTIRSNSDLVLVDVTVNDSKHIPVHHLDVSQFTVLEDGHPQAISFFEEHSANTARSKVADLAQSVPKLPAGTFTNLTTAPPDGTLNILLIDRLNTPVTEQAILRDKVLKFLREMPADRKLAIFVLTTHLSMLQGFTSDPDVLRAALSQLNGKPQASPFIPKPITEDAGSDPLERAALEGELAANFLAGGAQAMQQGDADFVAAQFQHRSDYTLDALNLLAHYISTLQGRKNLIWLSGAFPVSILPDPGAKDQFSKDGVGKREYRKTIDLLRRSQVAVYPIDVRGLKASPVWRGSEGYDANGVDVYSHPGTLVADMNLYENTTINEHIGMNQMAIATGGRAYADSNDLNGAIASAIEAGSNYYTIAYSPANHDWNGRYRKIEVQLARSGMELAYRRGYYADPIQPQGQPDSSPTEAGNLQRSALHVAMLHGSPELSELTFQTEVRPSTDAVETAGAKNNQISKDFAGPYRRFQVTFSVKAGDMDCELKSDGTHRCEITFLTCVYDQRGTLANDISNHAAIGIPPDKYAEVPNRNFVFHQEISIPVRGEYYLRMGIQDNNSGKMGALEIPVAAVEKLAPATQNAAQR